MSKEITVTVHISPDCSPETIKALAEMMKLLVAQMEQEEPKHEAVTTTENSFCTCSEPAIMRDGDIDEEGHPRCVICGKWIIRHPLYNYHTKFR